MRRYDWFGLDRGVVIVVDDHKEIPMSAQYIETEGGWEFYNEGLTESVWAIREVKE